MDKKEGYKILVNGTSRKLKPAVLLKASTTANPIADKCIQGCKQSSQECKEDTCRSKSHSNPTGGTKATNE